MNIPDDYTFSPLHNSVISLACEGIRPFGSSPHASTATLSAALAVLYAHKLGCTVEAAMVGRVSCAETTHWLVTVRPHYGRCDLLDCLYTCGTCDVLDELTPDLHGSSDYFSHKLVRKLVEEWAYLHAEFIASVAERLGARSDWTAHTLLDGLDLPQAYHFERNFGDHAHRASMEQS